MSVRFVCSASRSRNSGCCSTIASTRCPFLATWLPIYSTPTAGSKLSELTSRLLQKCNFFPYFPDYNNFTVVKSCIYVICMHPHILYIVSCGMRSRLRSFFVPSPPRVIQLLFTLFRRLLVSTLLESCTFPSCLWENVVNRQTSALYDIIEKQGGN